MTLASERLDAPVPSDRRTVLYPYVGTRIGGSYIASAMIAGYVGRSPRWRAVACLPRRGDNAPFFDEAGVETVVLDLAAEDVDAIDHARARTTLGVRVRWFLRARRFLAEHAPDLVHIQDTKTMAIWGTAAKLAGIPVVFHVHGEVPSRWDRFVLLLSDHLVYVAASNATRFARFARLPPTKVIYNPVDVETFHPPTSRADAKAALGLPTNRTVVGFVGNLSPRKRPEWMVDACLELMRTGHDVHALVVGEDHRNVYLEELVGRVRGAGATDRFSFLGKRRDVPAIMRALDILVLPSRERGEAFPLVVIEAMASGVAVLATSVAGIPEAIQDGVNGILADPHDYEDLVPKLAALATDGALRERLAIQGIEDARTRYSPQRCAEQVLAVYERVTRKNA